MHKKISIKSDSFTNNIRSSLKRTSILDSLPEFELSKIERLEAELKVSETKRNCAEKENEQLIKRIKELELQLEKEIEYNSSLKTKQKQYNEEVYKMLTKQLNLNEDWK